MYSTDLLWDGVDEFKTKDIHRTLATELDFHCIAGNKQRTNNFAMQGDFGERKSRHPSTTCDGSIVLTLQASLILYRERGRHGAADFTKGDRLIRPLRRREAQSKRTTPTIKKLKTSDPPKMTE